MVCGYAPAERRNKLLAMVAINKQAAEETIAFVDESEGAGERRILLLAACIQSVSVWERFSEDWDRVLNEEPKISGFHTREARNRTGNFKGWRSVDRDLKIIRLSELIWQHDIHAFSVWVSARDFAETIQAVGSSDLKHAYFLAFTGLVMRAASYQEHLGSTSPIRYVFDNKGDIGYEAQMWYPILKENAPAAALMGGTPTFEDDERVLPLQAADLVAWHKRRQKEFGPNDPECAATMRLSDLNGGELSIDRDALEKMRDHIIAVPGVNELRGFPSIYKQLKSQYRKRQRRERANPQKRDD